MPAMLKNWGFHATTFTAMCREGLLERTARGLYVLADSDVSAHFGLAEISKRIPGAVISLISALNFHELTTQIPHEVWLSIPRDTWLPGVAAPSELNDSLCRSELLGFQRRTPDASIQAHSKP